MFTKWFVLPLIVGLGMSLAVDFAGTLGQSFRSKGNSLPTAPAPREKRKPSEILLGKWKVAVAKRPIPDAHDFTFEFTDGGKVLMQYLRRGMIDVENTGTYKLVGDKLVISMPGVPNQPAWVEEFTIQSISEAELIMQCPPAAEERNGVPVRFVLKRIAPK